MRLSIVLFLLSLAGALAGAGLIGRWAVGLVLLAYSLLLAAFALLRDDGQPATTAPAEQTLDDVLDRARRAA